MVPKNLKSDLSQKFFFIKINQTFIICINNNHFRLLRNSFLKQISNNFFLLIVAKDLSLPSILLDLPPANITTKTF